MASAETGLGKTELALLPEGGKRKWRGDGVFWLTTELGAAVLGHGLSMREGEEGEGEVGCATGRMERGRERRPIAPFLFPFLFFFPSFPI